MKIRSASNTFATGTYKEMPWSAKRVDGAWKLKTKKPIAPGAKANIAHQINKYLGIGE